MIETQNFVRKPLHVQAVQVTSANIVEVSKWCEGVLLNFEPREGVASAPYIKVNVHRPMNERQTKAFVGDYILKGERGFKVYTEKAFRNSFDAAEQTSAVDPNQAALFEATPVTQAPGLVG